MSLSLKHHQDRTILSQSVLKVYIFSTWTKQILDKRIFKGSPSLVVMSSFIDLRLNKLTWALPYKSKTNIPSVEQGAVFMVLCLKQGIQFHRLPSLIERGNTRFLS